MILDIVENSQIYALLIGVGDYSQVDGRNLPTFRNDTNIMKDALRSGLGIPNDNLRVLIGENENGIVTSASVAYAIASFEKGLKENDSFILYFSGHGDNNDVVLSNGTIILQSLIDYLDKIPTKNKIVILDCCYSGNFKGSGAKQMRVDDLISEFAGRGIAVLASSEADELSRLNSNRNASVFTVALSDSIKNRKNVKNGNLSLADIYDGMMIEISDWNKKNPEKQQHPIFRSSVGGTIHFRISNSIGYQPLEIHYERQDYRVVKVKPLSTLKLKRLAVFVVTMERMNGERLSIITQEIVNETKNAKVYSSERSSVQFGNSSARAIWCYFACDDSELLNGIHYAYSIWAADPETQKMYFRENRDSETIRDVNILWNSSYDILKEMQRPVKTREQFVEDNKRLLALIVSLAEQFIYDLQEVYNHTFTMEMLFDKYSRWTQDVKDKYIDLSDVDIAPDDLKEWSDNIMDLAGWVLDIAVILEKHRIMDLTSQDVWLIKDRIKHYYDALENIKAVEPDATKT